MGETTSEDIGWVREEKERTDKTHGPSEMERGYHDAIVRTTKIIGAFNRKAIEFETMYKIKRGY